MHLFRIPQCSIQNRMFWMEHCGIWNRCILGFVKSVYSLNHLSWNYSHWALYINTVIRGERISIMEIRLAILPYLYHGDSCSYLWTRHEWDFAVASHHESHRARSQAPLHVTEGKRTRFPSDPHPFGGFDNWKCAVIDWFTPESTKSMPCLVMHDILAFRKLHASDWLGLCCQSTTSYVRRKFLLTNNFYVGSLE